MGERHEPCGTVHLTAEVIAVAFDRLTGVQAHPHREADGAVVTELLLRLDRGCDRVACSRERGTEAITAGGEHVAAAPFDRASHDGVVGP